MRLLSGEQAASADTRAALVDKLERWRYQSLNQAWGKLTDNHGRLADALDLAANELAGRRSRPPRTTRMAVHDPALETGSVAEALALLDANTPTDELVRRAASLTLEHFGVAPSGPPAATRKRRMRMYAPLYLSNECVNHCLYCGFRYPMEIGRKQLSFQEAMTEAEALIGRGFYHILLVAGEFPSHTTTAYFSQVLTGLRGRQVSPSIEIAPQSTESYARLVAAGACGLTLYQETYDETLYARYHVRGPKTSYLWRLESLDRAAEAGMPWMGLGVLLGLGEPRKELASLMRHARYVQERFPHVTLAFGLPRIHNAPASFRVPYPVDDESFVRFYCALRIAFPRAELVLSTRELPPLRNRLAKACITQISAGSSTAPGGYAVAASAATRGEQFHISDHRSPAEMAQWLDSQGFDVRWD
jgi:2-iminoacetate synthase